MKRAKKKPLSVRIAEDGSRNFVPGIPLYRQVQKQIHELIRASPDPAKISLTDLDLANRFGVSRITVRRAVDELVDAGLLYRISGIGTFVRSLKLREKLTLRSFLDPWSHGSERLTIRLGKMQKIKATGELATQLKVPIGDDLVYVQRLRFQKETLVVIDERYLRIKHARHLTEHDVTTSSFVEYFRQRENIVVDHGDMEIDARGADTHEAKIFGIKPKHPLLVRRVTLYTHRNKPILSGVSLYRADRVSYRVTLTANV